MTARFTIYVSDAALLITYCLSTFYICYSNYLCNSRSV